MKTYGSTTGIADTIYEFYGAVDHKARRAIKVYAPVNMLDGFDNCTIQSGGVGNITGTINSSIFSAYYKIENPTSWGNMKNEKWVFKRFEVVRSRQLFSTRVKLNLIYTLPGSTTENTFELESYSSDANATSGFANYSINYKTSGLSYGTDVINATEVYTPGTRLIKRSFTHGDWGEVTFYTGYTTTKSLQYAPGSYDSASINSITYTRFSDFITNYNIDTSGQVEFVGSSTYADRYWVFPKVGGGTLQLTQNELNSITGINGSNYTTQHLYFVFFDKHIVDTTSTLTTKKLLSGEEYESLCVNCNAGNTPMYNPKHTINGTQVTAGAITKFVFGSAPGIVGDNFLYYDENLTEINTTKWQINTVGDNFLYHCANLVSGDINLPSSLVSLGSYFLYSCSNYTGSVTFESSAKIKTINQRFMYYCIKYNHPIILPNSVTTIDNYFLASCSVFNSTVSLPSTVTTIGGYFMQYCYAFNQPITLPSNLTSIGNYFLYYCSNAFNQIITLPASLTTIGNYFLGGCAKYNQPLTIPSTVTSIGTNFLTNMRNMTSTITCEAAATVAATSNYTFCAQYNYDASYTTGIKLGGTYGSAWQSRFPDRSSSPYRNTDAV